MKRSGFDETKEQEIAKEAAIEARLMCQAHGCPNRWTIECGQRLCSPHFHAEPHTWPSVTHQQQWRETERARRNGEPLNPPPQVPTVSAAQKREILNRLRTVLSEPKKPREWITRLQEKRASGELLSVAQRHALAQVERGIPNTPWSED